jgi:hypothetical protein
MLSN